MSKVKKDISNRAVALTLIAVIAVSALSMGIYIHAVSQVPEEGPAVGTLGLTIIEPPQEPHIEVEEAKLGLTIVNPPGGK